MRLVLVIAAAPLLSGCAADALSFVNLLYNGVVVGASAYKTALVEPATPTAEVAGLPGPISK